MESYDINKKFILLVTQDMFPSKLALLKLRYSIGFEPHKPVSINQHSDVGYSDIVKGILKPEKFKRIRETFMEPMINVSKRHLQLLGKTLYVFLTRSTMIVKKHEVWFHFGAQSLRFSTREFLMIIGV